MKTRRGSSLWPSTLSGASMVNQYKPGDIVTSSLTRESDFIGVVRGVDPKINKVYVAWAGGAVGQHDPDEIHFEPHQSELVKSRMASRRPFAERTAETHKDISKSVRPSRPCNANDLFLSGNGQQCGNCGAYTEDHGKTWEKAPEGKSRRSAADPATDPQFVGDPSEHGIDKPRGGGFSIMQDLVKDQRQEMHEESKGGNPKMAASFKPGDEVEIAINSGVDSGKRGTVVSQQEVKVDGRGVPSNVEGAYKEVDWKKEVAIRLDDGELITMFKNRVKKASELRSRRALDDAPPPEAMDPTDVLMQYTADVAKELLKHRKTHGLQAIRQNYKGTGSQRAKRQLWVRFTNGEAVDVWLEEKGYSIGGVTILRMPGRFPYEGKTPVDVAKEIAEKLKSLSQKTMAASELRSRRAMYWSNPERVYRLTKREIVDSAALCPRCRNEMALEPYTRTDRMYRCPSCSFKIPRSNVIVSSLVSRRAKIAAEMTEAELGDLRSKKLSELAAIIRRDWKSVNFAAKPYLEAMESLSDIKDNYMSDSGTSITSYFLANASQYKGPVAKLVKKELNRRLK